MTVQVLTGDARDLLPTLEERSVQCVVTSPPYFGLRDYGTAQWEGGAADCDHVAGMARGDTEL
jgi:DNA modification methylase